MSIGKYIKFNTRKDNVTEENLDGKGKTPIKMQKSNEEEEEKVVPTTRRQSPRKEPTDNDAETV